MENLKAIGCLWLCLILVGCNSADSPDCFRSEGETIEQVIATPEFDRIIVEDDIRLVVVQDSFREVRVRTGENLFPAVSVEVTHSTLRLKDNNGCNLVRDFGVTQITVTTPDLKEIRQSSSFDIRSQGVLGFSNLRLISNTTNGPQDVLKGGDFYLQLDSEELFISANGQSAFFLSGSITTADIRFTDELPRLEAPDLEIQDLSIIQRSANVMIVHPVQSIRGSIFGTGDVIAVNRPPVVEVETFFTGRLRFED